MTGFSEEVRTTIRWWGSILSRDTLSPQDSPLFGSSLRRHTDVADEAVHGFLVVSDDGDVFSVFC